jgi:cytoskeletal protein CcmA (bactofilin family)
MFSKTSSSGQSGKSGGQQKANPPTIISVDLHIVGDLNCEGEIHIDGVIDGDVRGRILLVGESGTVKGDIIANTLNVHGTVTGQIKARTVNLAKTARVTGDLLHEDLSIQQGAFLEGHCKRINLKQDAGEGKIGLVPSTGRERDRDDAKSTAKSSLAGEKVATQGT